MISDEKYIFETCSTIYIRSSWDKGIDFLVAAVATDAIQLTHIISEYTDNIARIKLPTIRLHLTDAQKWSSQIFSGSCKSVI